MNDGSGEVQSRRRPRIFGFRVNIQSLAATILSIIGLILLAGGLMLATYTRVGTKMTIDTGENLLGTTHVIPHPDSQFVLQVGSERGGPFEFMLAGQLITDTVSHTGFSWEDRSVFESLPKTFDREIVLRGDPGRTYEFYLVSDEEFEVREYPSNSAWVFYIFVFFLLVGFWISMMRSFHKSLVEQDKRQDRFANAQGQTVTN